MKLRNWLTLSGLSLAALGTGAAIKSLLPQRFMLDTRPTIQEPLFDTSTFPSIDVLFLRCGSVTVPEFIAVQGAFSLAPRMIAHSAVLVRHPQATFLFDTGLCANIHSFMKGQSLFFRKTLGNFKLECSLADHLQRLNMTAADLDFVLLSHLHWDHVSGIPDIAGVPLHVNQVEYDAASLGRFEMNDRLVARLIGNSPMVLFECTGPSYEGFRSSYDLFGDGSIMLVPLPGHTAGQVGMLINRSNGTRLFLLGDAAWVSENYLRPAPMHPFIWSRVTSDDATARQTLTELYYFAQRHPEIPLLAMHDARMQDTFMRVEKQLLVTRAA